MTPTSSGHSNVIAPIQLLFEAVGGQAFISPPNPVRLDDHSEPVPDFAVLKLRAGPVSVLNAATRGCAASG